jgi:hypothetical protein
LVHSQQQWITERRHRTSPNPVLPVTKVSLLAAKSIACHTPFVTDFLVPITVIKVRVKRPFIFAHRMEELTFPKGPSTGIDIRVAIFLASTWFELDSGDASFVGLVFKLDVEYSGGRTLSAPIKI